MLSANEIQQQLERVREILDHVELSVEVLERGLPILRDVFKKDSFHPLQLSAITNILHGNDTFCVMATGFGKSLIYQFPAVWLEGKTVVVIQPTVSLMDDQRKELEKLKIPVCVLGSLLSIHNRTKALEDLRQGKFRVLLMAPETAAMRYAQDLLRDMNSRGMVSLFAVDETHCVDTYSNFRKSYTKLGSLRNELLPHVPLLALTATATVKMLEKIIYSLQMRTPLAVIRSSVERLNLYLEVRRKSSYGIKYDLQTAFRRAEERGTVGPTIIYAPTKQKVEDINWVVKNELRLRSAPYHSDRRPEYASTLERFMANQLDVVVATSGFGLGINKQDVRLVINYGPTWSLEDYPQQTGRASRDGAPATCIAFYREDDFYDEWCSYSKKRKLSEMRSYLRNKDRCRWKFLSERFGPYYKVPRKEVVEASTAGTCCDNCNRWARERGRGETTTHREGTCLYLQ